jgi:hypothetical protein
MIERLQEQNPHLIVPTEINNRPDRMVNGRKILPDTPVVDWKDLPSYLESTPVGGIDRNSNVTTLLLGASKEITAVESALGVSQKDVTERNTHLDHLVIRLNIVRECSHNQSDFGVRHFFGVP